jgi:hypothetical protein
MFQLSRGGLFQKASQPDFVSSLKRLWHKEQEGIDIEME